MKITRRNSLELLGLFGAGSALTGCTKKKDPYALAIDKAPVPGSDKWYRGQERFVTSSCGQCPVNCGIVVRVVEGRAVKIDGNPICSLNNGILGPKGQTGLFTLYDPDRITTPLKRDGERGAGSWKEISWDEAVSEVAGKLRNLRDDGRPEALSVFCGRQRGFMKEMFERFCRVYGTPNFYDSMSTTDGLHSRAMMMMTGDSEIPGFDAVNTSYILSLGSALFESTCHGIYFRHFLPSLKREHPIKRTKIVQVDTHRSITAFESDEWLRIKPGTYDVFALGIAHLLLTYNRYDKDYIEQRTAGFEEFRELAAEYDPEHVEAVTGIRQRDTIRIARELYDSRPSVVMIDPASTATSNGFEIARCALALNALLGSVERPGGLVSQAGPPLTPWPDMELDDTARHGLAQPRVERGPEGRFPLAASVLEAFPEGVRDRGVAGIEALFLYYSNPLFSRNLPSRFKDALEKIPFIVSFSPFMDESAHVADLVLPDHTYLERYEDATSPPSRGFPMIGIRKPVVKPLYNTEHSGDVLIRIAKGLEGTVAAAFPWKHFRDVMTKRMSTLFTVKTASIKAKSGKSFLKALFRKGHWEHRSRDVGTVDPVFKTPSGKFEFYSRLAEQSIRDAAAARNIPADKLLNEWGKPGLRRYCLPHEEPSVWEGEPDRFPFYLIPYKSISYAEGSGANIPLLQTVSGLQRGLRSLESWRSWVAINDRAARDLRLGFGDLVSITSPHGKVSAYVQTSDGIPGDIVLFELGKGHTQMGRFAAGKGSNPKEILSPFHDPATGTSPTSGTRVSITKIRSARK